MTDTPLISLVGVNRQYPMGDETTTVLKAINLTICRGEMVAIIGASGSGKSTLMNILGCLDQPSQGEYFISGHRVADLEPDELAALRREHFGFIFQRYHLLNELDALGNVEIPAIYAGRGKGERRAQAKLILKRLGMGERSHHRPNQLSGGQQQRVSIARALINGADVILADEPTGALDSHSGEEVLGILQELNREGHTIIIVTHDRDVAASAKRIIEINDGEIISDVRNDHATGDDNVRHDETPKPPVEQDLLKGMFDRFSEALVMALRTMIAHRLRTFLTMLGIIIGTSSVVCVVALGQGSQNKVLDAVSTLGTNTMYITSGSGYGDLKASEITTLRASDARELAKHPFVIATSPWVKTVSTVRVGAKEVSVVVNGVGDQYFATRNSKLLEGRFFDKKSIDGLAQEAVIDQAGIKILFPNLVGSVVGKIVLMKNVPSRIVGVVKSSGPDADAAKNLEIFLPYATVQQRMTGLSSLDYLVVRVDNSTEPQEAEKIITASLTSLHGVKDFFIISTNDIRKAYMETADELSFLIIGIAGISLFVGGIGVMNIMLVSVSERINEIGVRMAIGARQSDILQQFLIEAILVCLVGAILGVFSALAFGVVFSQFNSSSQLIYSPLSVVVALLCSSLIGIGFGFLPAYNASKLDPVAALTRD